MKKNIFNKAGALKFLEKYQDRVGFVVPKFFSISKKEYQLSKKNFLKKVEKNFKNKKIILI